LAIAAHVTADESRRWPAAAATLGQHRSLEDRRQQVRRVDELGGSSVREDVRVAARQHDDLTGLEPHRLAALDPNGRLTFGDEMEWHEARVPGARSAEAPRAAGAWKPHDASRHGCRCRDRHRSGDPEMGYSGAFADLDGHVWQVSRADGFLIR
jgi:hypothetical protein